MIRVREAVMEIWKEARGAPLLAAEGAVRFLEKVSPALEQVDSSSGAIGTARRRVLLPENVSMSLVAAGGGTVPGAA